MKVTITVCELKLRPASIVVCAHKNGLADNFLNRLLVFLRQVIQHSWWNCLQDSYFAGIRFHAGSIHGSVQRYG